MARSGTMSLPGGGGTLAMTGWGWDTASLSQDRNGYPARSGWGTVPQPWQGWGTPQTGQDGVPSLPSQDRYEVPAQPPPPPPTPGQDGLNPPPPTPTPIRTSHGPYNHIVYLMLWSVRHLRFPAGGLSYYLRFRVHLDENLVLNDESTHIKACSLELVGLELRFHGAILSSSLSNKVTHVVVDSG